MNATVTVAAVERTEQSRLAAFLLEHALKVDSHTSRTEIGSRAFLPLCEDASNAALQQCNSSVCLVYMWVRCRVDQLPSGPVAEWPVAEY